MVVGGLAAPVRLLVHAAAIRLKIALQPETVLQIRDVYPGSRVKKILDPGTASNNLNILFYIIKKIIWNVHP